MSEMQKKLTWMFYIISAFCEKFALSWDEYARLDPKYRVSEFLMEHYELLHYYDNDYSVDDVVKHIRESSDGEFEIQGIV